LREVQGTVLARRGTGPISLSSAAFALILAAAPALATPTIADPFAEFDRPTTRDAEISIEATLQARTDGRDIVISGTGDRLFDTVLLAPDDSELNIGFARRAAAEGDLLSAAAALERLLLQQPNWHAARLFYAVTLYRMEDIQGAKRELDLLDSVELTPLQQAELAKYRRLIERRDRLFTVSGSVNAGLVYDSNATGALANLVDVGLGAGPTDDGLGFAGGGRLRFTWRLGQDSPTSLYLLVAGQGRKDLSGPALETLRAELALGLSGSLGARTSWQLGGLLRHLQLFGDPYMTEYGGRLALGARLGHLTSLDASAEATQQDFDERLLPELAPGLTTDARSGSRVALAAGLSHRVSGASSVAGEVGWESKNADYRPFAFSGPHVAAAFQTDLGRGSYSSLAGNVRFLTYREPDPLIGGPRRKETRSFVRAALGAPISAFTDAGATADFREGLILEGALSYTGRNTRAPYIDYENVGGELRLIWTFGE
jgi:hypothetical protein